MLQFISAYKKYIISFFVGYIIARYVYYPKVETFVVNVGGSGPSITLEETDMVTMFEIAFNIETKLSKKDIINLIKVFRNVAIKKQKYTNKINPTLQHFFSDEDTDKRRISFHYDKKPENENIFKRTMDKYMIKLADTPDKEKATMLKTHFFESLVYERKSLKDMLDMMVFLGVVTPGIDIENMFPKLRNSTNRSNIISRDRVYVEPEMPMEVNEEPSMVEKINGKSIAIPVETNIKTRYDGDIVLGGELTYDGDIVLGGELTNKTKMTVAKKEGGEDVNKKHQVIVVRNDGKSESIDLTRGVRHEVYDAKEIKPRFHDHEIPKIRIKGTLKDGTIIDDTFTSDVNIADNAFTGTLELE